MNMASGIVQLQFSILSRQFAMTMARHGFARTNKETCNPIFFREFNEGAQVQFCQFCQYGAAEAHQRMVVPGHYIRGGFMHRGGFADEWEEVRRKRYYLYDSSDCHYRFGIYLDDPAGMETAVDNAIVLLDVRKTISKEEDHAEWKRLEREFRAEFHALLKPYGFKKKGLHSILSTDNGLLIDIYPQKSSWSDTFYFNVSIGVLDTPENQGWYDPILPGTPGEKLGFTMADARMFEDTIDWRMADCDVLLNAIRDYLEIWVLPVINMPPDERIAAHLCKKFLLFPILDIPKRQT